MRLEGCAPHIRETRHTPRYHAMVYERLRWLYCTGREHRTTDGAGGGRDTHGGARGLAGEHGNDYDIDNEKTKASDEGRTRDGGQRTGTRGGTVLLQLPAEPSHRLDYLCLVHPWSTLRCLTTAAAYDTKCAEHDFMLTTCAMFVHRANRSNVDGTQTTHPRRICSLYS